MQQVIYDRSQGMRVPAKIWTNDIDQNTIQQIIQVCNLPFLHKHVAIMPDAHFGKGVPIGSVVATNGYIIPNMVSADIGCGMCALNTGIPVSEIDVDSLMNSIMGKIPVGISNHSDKSMSLISKSIMNEVEDIFRECYDIMNPTILNRFNDQFNIGKKHQKQIGTLGGGNHFCELQKDSNGIAWFMIHSGSRGLGGFIGDGYTKIAQNLCERYFSYLPNKDLAFLPDDSDEGLSYISCMKYALKYAFLNRKAMMESCISSIQEQFDKYIPDEMINIHHNYAALENHFGNNVWVHRKGATCVRKGVTGIIPGSMCTKSYIVDGLGNQESFHSCSHGSGRNFSRKEAKTRIQNGIDKPQDEQLGSVRLFGISDAHDELASAYKDVDTVMGNQTDLVSIRVELTPVSVLKG